MFFFFQLMRLFRNDFQRNVQHSIHTSDYKAGFHMIADRRSQIAIRSAIVCDHMETTSAIVCDPAIVIADDRRR